MRLTEIQAKIETIRALANLQDQEAAHVQEDSLRETVLQSIANGTCEAPQAAAALALQTNNISFYRSCCV